MNTTNLASLLVDSARERAPRVAIGLDAVQVREAGWPGRARAG